MAAKKPEPAGRRESFFGQQVIRLMTKTCVANDVGPYAFTMLAIISAQQDAAKGRPVTYWNDQLMTLVGIKKWESFDGVRRKCVEAGWLNYQNRGRRSAGIYEVVIPQRYAYLSDSRCDEGSPMYPLIGYTVHPDGGDTEYPSDGDNAGDNDGDKGGYKAGYKRGDTPSLSLCTSPSPSKESTRLPEVLDCDDFRLALSRWLAYKSERRESYKPVGLSAMVSHAAKLATQHGLTAVIDAMDRAAANRWAGWDQPSSFAAGSAVAPKPQLAKGIADDL